MTLEPTKTFLKQHPLEKHMPRITPLIPDANLLIQGPESRFDSIDRSHAVWCKTNTRSSVQSVSLERHLCPREREMERRKEWEATHPTAENSAASSYSVNEMFLLCRAIASARPAMPAPVTSQPVIHAFVGLLGCWKERTNDCDVKLIARLR